MSGVRKKSLHIGGQCLVCEKQIRVQSLQQMEQEERINLLRSCQTHLGQLNVEWERESTYSKNHFDSDHSSLPFCEVCLEIVKCIYNLSHRCELLQNEVSELSTTFAKATKAKAENKSVSRSQSSFSLSSQMTDVVKDDPLLVSCKICCKSYMQNCGPKPVSIDRVKNIFRVVNECQRKYKFSLNVFDFDRQPEQHIDQQRYLPFCSPCHLNIQNISDRKDILRKTSVELDNVIGTFTEVILSAKTNFPPSNVSPFITSCKSFVDNSQKKTLPEMARSPPVELLSTLSEIEISDDDGDDDDCVFVEEIPFNGGIDTNLHSCSFDPEPMQPEIMPTTRSSSRLFSQDITQLPNLVNIPTEVAVRNESSRTNYGNTNNHDQYTSQRSAKRIGIPETTPVSSQKSIIATEWVTWTYKFEAIVDKLIQMDKYKYFSDSIETTLSEELIPPYIKLIKNPMDLLIVREKLIKKIYKDPWEVMEQVYLVFDNATYFNPRKSVGYKECRNLVSYFEERASQAMSGLGYCCGRLDRRVLYCTHKSKRTTHPCIINCGETYYTYKDMVICEKCFNGVKKNTIRDPSSRRLRTPILIEKDDFHETRNERPVLEPLVECQDCMRRFHQYCVMHDDNIFPEGFTCGACLWAKDQEKPVLRYTAKNIKPSCLAKWVEQRLKKFLTKEVGAEKAGEVFIRALSNATDTVQFNEEVQQAFPENPYFQDGIPYRSRVIFAFQLIDGVEVCFFAMYVQEYGTDCPPPNRRCVYLAYIDSVSYFCPRDLKTSVYQEIILGYLDFTKALGFTSAYIWAYPPETNTTDYIFRLHPPHQKFPKKKRLQEWYTILLKKGITYGIVQEFHNIQEELCNDTVKSVSDLPIFDGDLLLLLLECETENEGELKEKNSHVPKPNNVPEIELEVAKDPPPLTLTRNKTNSMTNGSEGDDLITRIKEKLKGYKKSHFVVCLQSEEDANPVIRELDPDIDCDLVADRDEFIAFSKLKNYEFSSLEKAKFSTMSLIYEMTILQPKLLTISCDVCGIELESRVNLKPNCHLCAKCLPQNGENASHGVKESYQNTNCTGRFSIDQQPLEENNPDLDVEDITPKYPEPCASRKENLELVAEKLRHASHCNNVNCEIRSCPRIKLVINHSDSCEYHLRGPDDCGICQQLFHLCVHHAMTCHNSECRVKYCKNVQKKLSIKEAEVLKRKRSEYFETRSKRLCIPEQ